MHRNNILIYIQQDATLHSLFYLEAVLDVSGSTITHHQERKQLYIQHLLFVTPLLLSAAIVEELELVWVCCGWLTPPTGHDGWWYYPKHVEHFPDKINCVMLHLVGYTLERCEGLSYIRQIESNQILLLLLLWCCHHTSIQETST